MNKQMKFGFALLALLLCAAQAAPIKDNTLSGKIVDWPAGKTGRLELTIPSSNSALVSTPVDASGKFSLKLPATLPGNLPKVAELFSKPSSWGDACQTVGPAKASGGNYEVADLNAWIDNEKVGDIQLESSARMDKQFGDTSTVLMYFSAATTLQGNLDCNWSWGRSQQEFTGQYPAGWNTVRRQFTGKPPTEDWNFNQKWSYQPALNLNGLAWRLYEEFGGIGVNFNPDSSAPIVEALRPGGAAETAGLKAGDLISSVDGKAVQTAPDVIALVRGEPNTKVKVTVKRGDQELTFELTRAVVRVP